ncbi:unnamed protein product [Adineta steineri]|uniref:CCHC-type domain-containing protein n=1 Tax=Adineta steineri TaxID=433720 RepID=A0A815UYB8_9BILA|nr:unnamed protein product [Adineta steineri]
MNTSNQTLFDSPANEMEFKQRIIAALPLYNGESEHLSDWLRDAGAFFSTESISDAHQVFAIRSRLTDQALDIFSAHEDLIHNFYDLRKLLLQTAGKAPLRTLASLDSISNVTFNMPQPVADSTRLDSNQTTTTSLPTTSITFTQSADDLTQNEYRKSIIAQFQEDKSLKFSGDNKQDVLKWIEKLERKFEIAEISDVKKFDFLTELLDKGALNWFLERKSSFNRSWSAFVEHFKKVYDSPNRSLLAFQKLQSYHQSADQDTRSFCDAMRKLCREYDPDMSPKMKLDFLLRSVNPTYRPEILKLKPTSADAFEQIAIDVEHTFITLTAYETYTPSTVTTYTSSPLSGANYIAPQQSPASNYPYRGRNNFRSNQRPPFNTTFRPFTSSPNYYQGRRQSSNFNSSQLPRPQQFVASASATHTVPPSYQSLPPLMPPSSAPPPPPPPPPPPAALLPLHLLSCQWCNQQGHSARDCPF